MEAAIVTFLPTVAAKFSNRNWAWDGIEDLAQEVVIKALANAAQFRDTQVSNLQAWLWVIMRNRLKTEKRSHARRKTFSFDPLAFTGEFVSGGDGIGTEISVAINSHLTYTPEPLVGMMTCQVLECLEDHRIYYDALADYAIGFTHGEIAARQGIPVGTVKSRICRGREALRDADI